MFGVSESPPRDEGDTWPGQGHSPPRSDIAAWSRAAEDVSLRSSPLLSRLARRVRPLCFYIRCPGDFNCMLGVFHSLQVI